MRARSTRRGFLNRLSISTAFASGALRSTLRAQSATDALPAVVARQEPERPPPLPLKLVGDFVRVSHSDIERVRELIAREPRLVYASWDWGGGDWETGLGGASHIGRGDIARTLLSNGARKDIFAASMLGEREVVMAMVKVDPKMAEQIGPHGFRVLYHVAICGDVETAEVVLSNVKDAALHLNQALSAAVRDGHYDMTRWLLERGATSVNEPNTIGERPLRTATRRGDTRIVELLRKHGATDLD